MLCSTISKSRFLCPTLIRSSIRSLQVHIGNQMSFSTSGKTNFATADLCDAHISSPERLQAAEAGTLFDFGGIKSFHGQIETVRCFESNPLVRKTLGEPGHNRVLVVDGGGSKRVAILGDQLAAMAKQNNWAGIIVNGCIRDSRIISTIPIGVKALGTHPLKSLKDHEGEKSGSVAFAGLEFRPGQWVYADEDGVIISENELTLRKL